MGGLVIVVPRTEPSMALLGSLMRTTLPDRLECLAMPLPREFCVRFVETALSGRDLGWVNDVLGEGEARLWGPVLEALGFLARAKPSLDIECLYSMNDFLRLREVAVDVARLVLRVRLGGRVTDEEWLGVFKEVGGVRVSRECPNMVVDGYPYDELMNGSEDVIALGPVIPTPVELLGLVALGHLDKSMVGAVTPFVVRYVGDYVVMSRSLAEAYGRLLGDREYVGLLRSVGVPLIL